MFTNMNMPWRLSIATQLIAAQISGAPYAAVSPDSLNGSFELAERLINEYKLRSPDIYEDDE